MTAIKRLLATGTVMFAVTLGSAVPAQAYDPGRTRTTADAAAYRGVYERYVFGGSTWRDNDYWDSDEGSDCSGYAAKIWGVPNTVGAMTPYHPYSTYDFYYSMPYGFFRDVRYGSWLDIWVFRRDAGGPSDHMGLFRSRNSDGTWNTYEARGSSYGIVIYRRSLSTLIDWRYRRGQRNNWG